MRQNIDGFHTDAGSKNLIEIHGSFRGINCTNCAYQTNVENYSGFELLPKCPECNSLLKPTVVLFNESLPLDAVERYHEILRKGFDVVFSIGTSSQFPYIAEPFIQHYRIGYTTIEINPDITDLSRYATYHLQMSAGDALTKIWQELTKEP